MKIRVIFLMWSPLICGVKQRVKNVAMNNAPVRYVNVGHWSQYPLPA